MANPVRGERKLKIGEKEYTILFNMNALAILEAETGMTMPKISKLMADPENIGITFMRSLLFAGLQKYHKDEVETPEDVGELMEVEDYAKVFPVVAEAFASALGADKPSQKKVVRKK